MKVSEYINYLVNGDASKLAIKDVGDMSLNPTVAPNALQLVNQGKFVNYINLANSHTRDVCVMHIRCLQLV